MSVKQRCARAGNEDLKTILEDLGTLSALPPMTSALKQSYGSQRFQWLKPWRWITGFGWQGGKRRGTVELTVQIRGTGLENCSSVQVGEKPLKATRAEPPRLNSKFLTLTQI